MDEQLKAYFGKYLAEIIYRDNGIEILYWNFKPENIVLYDLCRMFPTHAFFPTRMYDAAAIRAALATLTDAELEQLSCPILSERMEVSHYYILLAA